MSEFSRRASAVLHLFERFRILRREGIPETAYGRASCNEGLIDPKAFPPGTFGSVGLPPGTILSIDVTESEAVGKQERAMDRFRDALHALCAGLHMEHCDPRDVVILLPWKQWWDLHCSLERKYGGLMTFDGRGDAPNDFRYLGITFRAKNDQAADQSNKRAA